MPITRLTAVEGSSAILLGCDEPELAETLTVMLREMQFEVQLASDGEEVLRRLQSAASPAIVLLDMDLKSRSGVEIAWTLSRQAERPGWIALMSRNPGPDRRRAALDAGCDDLLSIPPDPAELGMRLRAVERVLELERQVQRQKAELRYRATHDGLTGLWNREALLSLVFQETDRVQRMKTPLSLLLLDLDDFSTINHDYGYEAGDRVLAEMANRFRRHLRSYDLIGRCGEDDFLLALPGCGGRDALHLAERIRETILARPFAVGNGASTLTATFAVAESGGRSPLIVLREAEHALAEAKLEGKNRARCYATPPDRAEFQPELEEGEPRRKEAVG